jgi:aminoglycoside phosphotransferase (APT) family kinase protein
MLHVRSAACSIRGHDRALLTGADAVLKAYDDVRVREADCALVHTDVALHNLAFDPYDHVCGMYDYEEAAWADRHHDFRYLVIGPTHDTLLEIAISEYQARTGYTIERDRVMLYNAACALTYLAHRARTSPDERPCGRTLDEDLQWSTAAVERVLGGRVS